MTLHTTTTTTNSISAISRLLLNQFWQNFKRRLFGPSWTDSMCQSDICQGIICPCNICPYQEYLSCYLPNFDQASKLGSWDHLWQMSAVIVTFVQSTFVLATFVHIRNDSTLTFTKLFGPNALGTNDICPGNICPGNIPLYQEYLGCYWPDFDQTLQESSWILGNYLRLS